MDGSEAMGQNVCMASDGEQSGSGSPIYRHSAGNREWQAPLERPETSEELEGMLAALVGPPETVFHEIVSDLVHLDVHCVPPTEERPWWTLFTTGMSDLPMSTPPGAEAFQYAELMVKLPADWRMEAIKANTPPADLEQWYWPIRWLKQLARLPHEYGTWLGPGHTIPNGDPARPFAPGTKLSGFLLLLPDVADDALPIQLSDGRAVNLYVLHALHSQEMQLKLDKGAEALLDALDRANVKEVLDPSRPSAARRKFLGLF